jgi:hypothetical protein
MKRSLLLVTTVSVSVFFISAFIIDGWMLSAFWSIALVFTAWRGRTVKGSIDRSMAILAVVTVGATFAANVFNHFFASAQAMKIVNACQAFKHDRGEYPERLEALVPNYLAEVPNGKIRLGNRWVYARPDGTGNDPYPFLSLNKKGMLTPFVHQIVDFRTGTLDWGDPFR